MPPPQTTLADPRRFVQFPGLRRERSGDAWLVENKSHGTRIEASDDVLELLEAFTQPTPLATVQERYGLSPEDLAVFIHNHFLVAEDDLAALKGGFLESARDPPMGTAVTWLELPDHAAPDGWVAFGAPVDVAAGGEPGARRGPQMMRLAAPRWLHRKSDEDSLVHIDLKRLYQLKDLHLLDVGDVVYRASESYSLFGERVQVLVRGVHALGMRPLMMGGDHSLTWFALQALLPLHERLGVIHFDAHHDIYDNASGELGHQNPFTFALQHPSLAVLFQLGVRTVEAVGGDEVLLDTPQLSLLSAHELQHMTPEQAFAALPRDIPYYLTFDVDCMDPSIAPETGTTLPGGLSYHQALALVDYAARNFRLVGADFVEVAGGEGRLNYAASIASTFLGQCVLGGCGFGPLSRFARTARSP